MTLGERVRALRKNKGVSQEALGAAIDVWQTTISQIESDDSVPSMKVLRDLARYFEMEPSDLIAGVEIVIKEAA
jgi:transcriptional regulator with XRE-family HTH domain